MTRATLTGRRTHESRLEAITTSLRLLETVNLCGKAKFFSTSLSHHAELHKRTFYFDFEPLLKYFLEGFRLSKLCKDGTRSTDAKIHSKSIKNLHKLKPQKLRQESFAWIYINYSASSAKVAKPVSGWICLCECRSENFDKSDCFHFNLSPSPRSRCDAASHVFNTF